MPNCYECENCKDTLFNTKCGPYVEYKCSIHGYETTQPELQDATDCLDFIPKREVP